MGKQSTKQLWVYVRLSLFFSLYMPFLPRNPSHILKLTTGASQTGSHHHWGKNSSASWYRYASDSFYFYNAGLDCHLFTFNIGQQINVNKTRFLKKNVLIYPPIGATATVPRTALRTSGLAFGFSALVPSLLKVGAFHDHCETVKPCHAQVSWAPAFKWLEPWVRPEVGIMETGFESFLMILWQDRC